MSRHFPDRATLAGVRWRFVSCHTCRGSGFNKRNMKCVDCRGFGYRREARRRSTNMTRDASLSTQPETKELNTYATTREKAPHQLETERRAP